MHPVARALDLLALPTYLKFPAFGVIFLLGSVGGWVLSYGINLWVLGVRYASKPADVAVSIGITGMVTLVVGTAIATIQVLRDRLEESIGALKEKEYRSHWRFQGPGFPSE